MAAIDAAFCKSCPGDLGRVDDAVLQQVDHLAGGGVEAGRTGLGLDLADDDRTFVTGVLGDEPGRGLQRRVDDAGTGGLISLEALDDLGHRSTSPHQGGAAAGHDAFFDGGTGGRQRVLDAVLLLLELDLGGRADLDDGHAAGQLGEALLELLAVPVRVGVVDLATDLGDATLEVLV